MINWPGGCDLPHLVGFRCSTLHGSEVETIFPLQNADKDLHRDVVEAIDRTSVDRLLSLHFSLEVLNMSNVKKASNWWENPRKGAEKGPKTIPTPSFPQPQWKLYGSEFSLEVWSKLLLPSLSLDIAFSLILGFASILQLWHFPHFLVGSVEACLPDEMPGHRPPFAIPHKSEPSLSPSNVQRNLICFQRWVFFSDATFCLSLYLAELFPSHHLFPSPSLR